MSERKTKDIFISISAVTLAVVIQFALLLFDLPTLFIFLGFRFHIVSLIFFVTFLFIHNQTLLIEKIKFSSFKGLFPYSSFTLLIMVLILVSLYFTKNAKFDEPELFYEIGLSSIIDFPLYFLWNLPQFLILLLFLKFFQERVHSNFIICFIIVSILFSPQLILINIEKLDYYSILSYLTASILFSLIIKKFKSIYVATSLIYFVLWLNILSLGTDSITLGKMFLSSNFKEWSGFLIIHKQFDNIVSSAYFGIVTILFLFKHDENKRIN